MHGVEAAVDGARDRALGGRVPPSRSPERPLPAPVIAVVAGGAGAGR